MIVDIGIYIDIYLAIITIKITIIVGIINWVNSISILDKIGSYGKDIQGIKKEMEMIEDSFTKVIPELKKKKTTTHKKK